MLEFFIIILIVLIVLYYFFKKENSYISGKYINDQLNTIRKEIIQLIEKNNQTLDLNRNFNDLQSILKVPKTRGIHGELLLEEQLAKLPKEMFKKQFKFNNGNICDAVICLRDNRKLSIDSKFPLENFLKMTNASSKDEKKRFEKIFQQDVKKHINQIKEKYIIPGEGSLEFAFMYIPAENIYYHTFIGSKSKLDQYAFEKNVFPVSPHSLIPYLNIILFGLRALKIEDNASKIHKGLLGIQNKLESFFVTYRKAKEHLRNAQRNFEIGENQFTKAQDKLTLLVNQENSQDNK